MNNINSAELVAFSTMGIDTHGAYRKGVSPGLLKLLHKLGVGKNIAYGGLYTVPVSGIYQVVQQFANPEMNNSMLTRYRAGDTINIYSNKTHIHRLSS